MYISRMYIFPELRKIILYTDIKICNLKFEKYTYINN